MGTVTWTIKHYDRNGSAINAADYDGNISNELACVNRTLNFYLNGVDEFDFSVYLDDPRCVQILPLTSFVKIWRTVDDADAGKFYSDPGSQPCFSGIVTQSVKNGEAGIATFKAYSPLWRLQSRFHILNHYFKRDPNTGVDYKHSALMFRFIDLVNEAFGTVAGFTGINQGTFAWAGEPTVAPYFQARGDSTWSIIFDDLMSRNGSPDIIPEYRHTDGNSELMLFSTDEKRGVDRTASTQFNYRVPIANLDNIEETMIVVPGEYANYVWIVGQGGPNSGKIAKAENNSAAGYGYMNIGIYMKRIDLNLKLFNAAMKTRADAELLQSVIPKTSYSVTLSPAGGSYYKIDFELGDAITLNANKGALSVSNKKQRIYQVTLQNSENNIETASPLVSDDFYGKVT